ncbi:MAG TPA: cytochrome c family protein [Aestuariivirgaceae bacterium]|jgi:cytochrome c|nr:cytochrome c family protein [Aestuariivirgaceae bacterium]
MKLRIALAALALLAASSPAALAAGDVEKGKAVFKRCQVCHVHDTKTNKVGPHLGDVVGRKAGSVEGFHYSDAMKKKGEEGLTWTEENIATYLKDPKAFVPGNKMVFVGLKKDDEIADVIAFLKSPPEQ